MHPDTFYVWDEKTDSMKPMEYPFDENLAPALWGTYEVDGKVYKTGMQVVIRALRGVYIGESSGDLLAGCRPDQGRH